MKANNGTGNNELRDSWQTPQWLFDELHEQYEFDFDCCAERGNKKTSYFASGFETVSTSDLSIHKCWMNPPFSKSREMFEHFFKVVSKGVAIYRCDNMETKLWQEVILPNASWVFIPSKRIAYEGMEGKGSRFPSALIGFNVPCPKIKLGGVTLKPHHKGEGA